MSQKRVIILNSLPASISVHRKGVTARAEFYGRLPESRDFQAIGYSLATVWLQWKAGVDAHRLVGWREPGSHRPAPRRRPRRTAGLRRPQVRTSRPHR